MDTEYYGCIWIFRECDRIYYISPLWKRIILVILVFSNVSVQLLLSIHISIIHDVQVDKRKSFCTNITMTIILYKHI